MRRVNPDYYGFLDEDDGVIIAEEAIVQKAALEKLGEGQNPEYVRERVEEICASSTKLIEPTMDYKGFKNYVSYVPAIPSQADIQQELLRLKKEEMLKQLQEEFGDDVMGEGEEEVVKDNNEEEVAEDNNEEDTEEDTEESQEDSQDE